MTDYSLSHITHTAPLVDTVAISKSSLPETTLLNPSLNGLEEEDYTIKCICGYQEDDGNTVFCEQCNTWQHVDCYYYKKDPPGDDDEHGCADCTPELELDAKRAADRQKKKREQIHIVPLKPKKKISGKSHKKVIRSYDHTGVHTNGWPEDGQEIAHSRNGHTGSPKDQHPAKRVKTSHRSSHSQNIPLNGAAHTSRRSTSASHALHSPSKPSVSYAPNGYHNEPYSPEFLHLYEDDPGDAPLQANSFNDIQVANDLSLWSNDIEALTAVANGRTHQDIFMRCEQTMDSMPLPQLQKEQKTDESRDYDGLHPSWTYLTINEYRPQNSIVGELRGRIGRMQDYVQDPVNRWEYLRHPLPFVFFHPHLPIHIDTRKEGTSCRYLRRSCTPNLIMKTILENGSDYHFCFVANKDLEPGTELTVGWTLDAHMRSFLQQKTDGIKQEGAADTDESYAAEWVGRVLADFGGCACDSPNNCSMAKYDRRHSSFSGDFAIYMSFGKTTKKQKPRNQVTSQSAGRTTTSRSGSEAIKRYEDDEMDDSLSTSTSARSKPNSRELTPSSNTAGESAIASGVEIEPRIKKKIELLEKNDKCQAVPKRRKRTSGGSIVNTPTTTASGHSFHLNKSPYGDEGWDQKTGPHSGHLHSQSNKPQYVDTGTLRKYSASPTSRSPLATTALSANTSVHAKMYDNSVPRAHSNYVDCSMQTDPDPEHDWATGNNPSSPFRRPFISLTKRLLMRCHKEKVESEMTRKILGNGHNRHGLVEDASSTPAEAERSSGQSISNEDTVMHDGDSVSPLPQVLSDLAVEKPRPPDQPLPKLDESTQDQASPLKSPPVPQTWSSLQQPDRKQTTNGFRTADLRVQLPPKQLFSGGPRTPSIITTPNSVAGSIAQSPLSHTPNAYPPPFSTSSSNIVTPSPAMKKLSLSDYISSRRGSHKVDIPVSASLPGTDAIPPTQAVSSSPPSTHITLKPPNKTVVEATDHPMDEAPSHAPPQGQNIDPLDHKMDTT
ncbi:hypothetical protein MMC34_003485 [Xylographa carneopallida]|nr:hypothetical protein [Xylographa carneopallida]